MKKDAILLLLCFLSTTIFSQFNITATSAQDTICQGESVALTAEGDIFDTYSWSPTTWITNPNISNPVITPPSTTTYMVTGTILGNNVITNGDFSQGNTGFSTEYLFGPNTNGGQWGDLSDEGTYAITTNPNFAHSNFANCSDHTNGFGNMYVANGSATAGLEVWCQSVIVIPNTTYEFSTWVTSVVSGTPAQLQFSINGNLLGPIYPAPAFTCGWEQFFETWDSGNNTNIEICIINQNTFASGNDFAIDDISFSPIITETSSVTVHVSEISAMIISPTSVGCDNTLGTAVVEINGGFAPYTYLWDNGETTAQAMNLTGGNHFVTVTDAVGCASITSVNIDSPQLPVIDEVVVEHTNCGFSNGILEVFPGAGTAPFQYSIDGVNFQIDPIFIEVAAGNYFVVIEDANGCTGAFQTEVFSSEVPAIAIETPHGLDLCGELPVILDAIDISFDEYLWSTGETTSSIIPTVGGTYEVTITQGNDGCTSSSSIELENCGSYTMPNAFTPDGDGVNDTFGPVITGTGTDVLDFKIYNRWGNLVHDERGVWNGELDGKPHPSDVLIYIIRLNTKDGEKVLNGDVSLIR